MGHSKVIVKNTIFLYLRTILIMLISIYTSRVLLDKLGVENYGIYNVVGGIVAIFTSLKGVFAQATQRFLNYEQGKGNENTINIVFNISLIIHLLLGVIFVILVGIFGYLYIPNYLVLPEGMLDTAKYVFFCSLLTAFVSIITTPFDAAIIANEKFDFYSMSSILDISSRLGVVYLLEYCENSLRVYAILIAGVVIVFRLVSVVYSFRFEECKLKILWDKQIFKELAFFSWWNFLGNTAYSLTNEGINLVINVFGGVSVNAARGLAYQVKSAVTQLCGNIGIASRPYISEAVVSKDKSTIFTYTIMISRAMYLMISLVVLPLLVYTRQIMEIWLVDVPEYSVIFVQLIMIQTIIRSPQIAIDILFSSYGKMKRYQIVQSISLFLSLPLSYIFLKIGLPIYWAFISMCIIEVLTIFNILVCANKVLGLSIKQYFSEFYSQTIISVIQLVLIGLLFYFFVVPTNPISVLLYSTLIVIVSAVISYFTYLTKDEKNLLLSFLNKKKNNNK